MTTSSILKVIQHYQRSIEECQNDESRLLHCIGKLYKLPVNVEHLQETGIGKTVNSLRKFNGEIGVAAKALVTKWKAMVTEEEPPAVDEQQHYPQGEASGGSSEDDHNSASEMVEKRSNGALAPANDKSKRSDSDSKLADSEKSRSRSEKSSSKHKTSSSEASRSESRKHHSEESHKRKREEGKEKSTHHKDKKRDRGERESGGHSKDSSQRKSSSSSEKKKEDSGSSKQHKSSKPDKSSEERDSSSKHTSKRDNNASKSKEESDQPSSREKGHRSSEKPSTSSTTSSSGKKRRHEEENAATKEDRSHHNAAKTPKSAREKKEDVDEPEMGIDSSMGANFADVLGMLDMPSKKPKSKTLNAVTHQTGPSTSSAAALSSRPLNGVSSSKDVSKHSHGGGGSHSDRPSSSSTKRTPAVPDEKPDLLSDNAKLEPLDASIALALPAISTNYKPMPLNQTVMDCVFNNGSSSKPPPRSFNDAEALSHGISSKTMRTKIYSGVRTGQIHQVPSLFDLCIRVLQKNIDALEYTGGVPFEVLRPVLERATPQQLMIFEEYNPYLMEDSDVLWKAHVQRNYRVQKRQEMESWREMFNRCQEDQERKLSILAETIKQSQKIVAAPVRKTQLAFVDTMVKPPRNVQRKQEIHGTKSKLIATPAARVAALSSVTPNAAKTGDARLRVAASVRDAAQVSHGSARPKKAPLMAKTLQFMRRKR